MYSRSRWTWDDNHQDYYYDTTNSNGLPKSQRKTELSTYNHLRSTYNAPATCIPRPDQSGSHRSVDESPYPTGGSGKISDGLDEQTSLPVDFGFRPSRGQRECLSSVETLDSAYYSSIGAIDCTTHEETCSETYLHSDKETHNTHMSKSGQSRTASEYNPVTDRCSHWVDDIVVAQESFESQGGGTLPVLLEALRHENLTEHGNTPKPNVHSMVLVPDATLPDDKASSNTSASSEPSQSSCAFDVDTWLQSSDDESGSTSDINPLLPLRTDLAIRLTWAYYTCVTSSSEDSASKDPHTFDLCSRSGTSSQPSEKSGKRRREEPCSSSGNDGPKSSRRRKTNSTACEEKLLACPFCKHDPRKYRDCYRYIMRNISRLKQHLARYHQIPIHCPSCSTVFDTEGDRDEHIRARSCEVQPPREWDGITESQKTQLRKRVSTNQTTEQNWYTIYEILFPGSPRPRSPYIDMPLSEELLGLREFAAEHGPNIISDVLEDIPEALRPNEEDVRTFSVTMFQDAVGLLLQRFSEDRSVVPRSSTSQEATEENPPAEALMDIQGDETALALDLDHQDPMMTSVGNEIPQVQPEIGTAVVEMQLGDAAPSTDRAPPPDRPGNVVPAMSDFEFIDPSYLQQLDEVATHWNPLFQTAFTSDFVA